jgi:hypothetical protein
MRNQTFIEIEQSDCAAEGPNAPASGIEVIEYFPGQDTRADVVDCSGLQATPETSRQQSVAVRGDSGSSHGAQLEQRCRRLEEELARVRQDSLQQIRAQDDRIAALLAQLSEREYESWKNDARIASLTPAGDGFHETAGQEPGPTTGIAVGFIEGHRRSGDLVESLKARVRERGQALRVLREELEVINQDRARLARALEERGQQVAQLLEQLTRSEVGRGFGMDFRSGLRGLFQRSPSVATRGGDGPEWTAAVDGDRTIVLGLSGAPSGNTVDCEVYGSAVHEGRESSAARGACGAQNATPPVRPAGIKLRRYLLPLQSKSDSVFELSGPRSYVGRGFVADVCISHPTISRLHAVLYWVGGATMLEDARSTNGVFVNRKRIQQAVLKDGDVVAFGNVEFSFRIAVHDT